MPNQIWKQIICLLHVHSIDYVLNINWHIDLSMIIYLTFSYIILIIQSRSRGKACKGADDRK